MKPDAEIRAIQERADRLLPTVVPKTFDRPVKVFVRRGEKEGSALVQFSYEDRWVGEEGRKVHERGAAIQDIQQVSLLTKWVDLAFKDFLDRSVKRLLDPAQESIVVG